MNLTLLSGGADTIFENCAKEIQYNIKIYKPSDILINNYSAINNYLKYININYLYRKYPTNSEYVNNLLRRDCIVGSESDVLYAISWLEKDNKNNINVNGGTAWAVMCFIDKCIKYVVNNKMVGIFNFPCYI